MQDHGASAVDRSAKRRLIADHLEGVPHALQDGPVFLYSGFRTCSTWLWTKFRAHERLLCYYEPFNEQLGGLTLSTLGEARPDGWRSHHPRGAPYALEYAGLLDSDAGVPGFPPSRDLADRYIGAAGPEGPLDEDVAAYVEQLIRHARSRQRVPLLACTRLLGRADGMKARFGGFHILLVRNLYQQWNSYAGQARFGNWYFLDTLYETLGLAGRDPVIDHLARLFPAESTSSLEAWVNPANFDNVFCYFVGFHLYFLTLARRSADLVVDANALSGPDPDYRREVVDAIAQAIGISLDLDDASERMDFPLHPIANRPACVILVDEIADRIKAACKATDDEKAFIDKLVADIWTEQAVFARQAAGAFEYLAAADARTEAAVEARVRSVQEDAEHRLAQIHAERDAFVRELEAARQELAQREAQAVGERASLELRLAEAEAALAMLRESAAHEQEVVRQEMTQREVQGAEERALLEARLAEADAALAALRDSSDRERAAAQQDLTQREAQAAQERAALETRLAEADAELAAVQAQLANLQQAHAQALDPARTKAEESAVHVAGLEQQLAAARDELARVTEAQAQVSHDLQRQEAWNRQLEAELATALARVAEQEGLLSAAEERERALQHRVDVLECSIARVDAVNADLTGRLIAARC